jgi:transposase
MVEVPWGRKESGFTLLFEAYVMKLVAHMPIAAVARLVGETDHRLWRILKFYIQGGVDRIDCSEVEAVGVDETSAKRNHDYISLFYDMRGRRLLFATDGKDADTFEEFGEFMWEHGGNILNVRELSCDMSPAFIKGARDSMDNAHVTFDRFHISKLLNEAVDKVRKSEAKKDKTIKGSMYLWLRNPENLTPSQAGKLEELKSRYGTLAEAYRLRQSFRDFYEQPDLRSARGFLKAWVTEALNSDISPIVKAANTIRRHWQGIIRWHISRINNGVLEALASLVQAAKRKARGYRNKDTLKLIAYLIAGKLDLRLPT